MAVNSLKSLLLTPLTLTTLIGCAGEALEPATEAVATLAHVQQSLATGTSEYRLLTATGNWGSALDACQGLGPGYSLATVNDRQEDLFLLQYLKDRGVSQAWLGFNDRDNENTFSWSSGEAVTYTGWLAGEPNDVFSNEDCTELHAEWNAWNDADCGLLRAALCERTNTPPAVSAGNGAWDYANTPVELRGFVYDNEWDSFHVQWSYTPGPDVPSWARCSFGSPGIPATSFSCNADGNYTVTLTAKDPLNPSVSSSVPVAFFSASQVTQCPQPLYTRDTTLALCGFATPGDDGGSISSAWFSVDGGPAIAVVPQSTGGFVSTQHTLTEGHHVIRLYAQSNRGHVTMREVVTNVDTTAPQLTVLSPRSQDTVQGPVVRVTSGVSDASPVKVTTQWMSSTELQSGTGTVTHDVAVNPGGNLVLVQARDAAGNVTEVLATVNVSQ